MKAYFSRAKTEFCAFSAAEKYLLLLLFSAFVSVYAQTAVLVVMPLFFLIRKEGKTALPRSFADWSLLLFSVLAAISTVLFARDGSGLPGNIDFRAAFLWLLGAAIVVLAFDLFYIISHITPRLFGWFVFLTCVFSYSSHLIALIQFFLGASAHADRPGRYASVYINENFYGTVIEFAVLIALYAFFRTRSKKLKCFYAVTIAANLASLLLCQCRTAFAVVGICVLLFLFIRSPRAWPFLLSALVIAVAIFFFFPSLLPRFEDAAINFAFRREIWKASWAGFLDSPLIGRGYYAYNTLWRDVRFAYLNPPGAIHAHNLYLEMLLDFGVIGTVAFLAFCFSKVKMTLKAACRRGKNELALAVSTLCAIAMHGFLDVTIFWPQTAVFAVFILLSYTAYAPEKE